MECRNCKETIADLAAWCPRCHRPQSRFRAWFSPQALTVVAFALAGYWALTFAALHSSVTELTGGSIYDGGDQLTLGDLRFRTSEEGCDACVSLTGTVTNRSEVAWSNLHFQVTYYDAGGEVIDVHHARAANLALGPGLTRRFRVKDQAGAEAGRYHHSEVVVTQASPDNPWN
jgi:hypothetical protein